VQLRKLLAHNVQPVATVDSLLQQLKASTMILGLHQPQHHLLAAGQPPLAMNLRFKPTYPSIPSLIKA
jgi:hypothetical protein